MILPWLFVSPAERRLLGGTRTRGATPWVIAIMSFSIVVVAAAGLALANTAAMVARSTEHRYSAQIPGGGRALNSALQAIRSVPGVTSAQSVPEAEMRKTLARWLGPQAAASADLPVPALVNFDLREGTDLRPVQRRVQAAAPGASITAHSESLKPLLRSLRTLEWLALALVLLLGTAAAAAVVLATRGELGAHSPTIQVMHGVGATDRQITHLFQRKIAIDAFAGSVGGAAAAGLIILLLFAGASYAGDLTGSAALGLGDVMILFLLPLALTGLAILVARSAVMSSLGQSL